MSPCYLEFILYDKSSILKIMLSFKISYYIIHKSNLNPYQKMFMVRPTIALFTPNRSVFNTLSPLVSIPGKHKFKFEVTTMTDPN
jgi:hypothetical protein